MESEKTNSEQEIKSFSELETLPSEQSIPKKITTYIIDDSCITCKKENAEYFCSKCKLVKYCCLECQKSDWKTHKDTCISIANQPNKNILSIEHFSQMRKIGEGNFSEIYKAANIFDHKTYSIKLINKEKVRRIRKEADIFMEKHCLSILKGSHYIIDIYSTFQDELNLYIQLEYVEGGELWEIVKVFGLESLSLVKYFMAQIITALEFIHSKGIVHRDLKTENILLDAKKNIKLIDFGTARDLNHPEIKGSGNSAKGKKVYDHFVGTPNFMAPECIRNRDSTIQSDIWSLGCVFFQLINGFPPFIGGSDYLIFQKSINEEIIFPDHIFNDDLKELISLMLKKDMESRISLNKIKEHKFFENLDFLTIRDQYHNFKERITKEEKFLLDIKENVLKENIVMIKMDELKKVMENIYIKIENSDFEEEEKIILKLKSKNLEKQFAHYYKLNEYEY